MRACDNPFRADRIDALTFQMQGDSWDAVHARLRAQGYRGCVWGPCGSGKSTFMRELSRQLAAQGHRMLMIRTGADHMPWPEHGMTVIEQVLPNGIVMIDGADHVSRWTWRGILRKAQGAKGLIIASHHPGQLPALHQCQPDCAVLDELLGILIPTEVDELRAQAHVFFARHQGNLRSVFIELYRMYAARGDGTV